MPQEAVQPSAEERLLAVLLRNPQCAPEIALRAERIWFESPILETAYDIAVTYACDHRITPSREILIDLMGRRSPETAGVHIQALARVDTVAVNDNEDKHIAYYCENLERDFKGRIAKRSMMAAADLLDKKDIDGAIEALQTGVTIPLTKFSEGELATDFAVFWAEYQRVAADPALRRGIQTGFKVIDEATGGMFRKELIVMVAGQGVGKSLFLGQVGVNASRDKKKILLVTVENNRETYMRRLYSNIAEVPYHDLKLGQLSKDDEAKLMTSIGLLPHEYHLKVVHMNPPCSARDIMNIMRSEKEAYDLLILDQITNSSPIHPRDFKVMDWRYYSQIAIELRTLAHVVYDGRGIPVLTAVHAAGGTTDKKELSGDDTALAKSIGYHADWMLWFTRKDGEFWIGRSKLRDASFEPFMVYPRWQYWQLHGEDLGPTNQGPAVVDDRTSFDPNELDRQGAAAQRRDADRAASAQTVPSDFVPPTPMPFEAPQAPARESTGLSPEDF